MDRPSIAERNRVKLLPRAYEVINGKPIAIFTKEENDILAQTCKWTIIGKFLRIRPSIDIIRSEFSKNFPGKGTIKIGAYDMKHVFINFDNVEDHADVSSRNFTMIGSDTVMTLEKWTTKFKQEGESTHAPVWITLPDLPWHYYEWDAICRIVEPIGIPLAMDKATISKTRPTTAKVRIEIDLTKSILKEVNVEIRNVEGNLEMFTQKVEYESIPSYCCHCKMQGHYDSSCRILHPQLRNDEKSTISLHNNNAHNKGLAFSGKQKDQRKYQGPNQRSNTTTIIPNKILPRGDEINSSHDQTNEIEMEEGSIDEGRQTVSNKKGKGNSYNNSNIKSAKDTTIKTTDLKTKNIVVEKGGAQTPKTKTTNTTVVVTHNSKGHVESMDVVRPDNKYNIQQEGNKINHMETKQTRLDKDLEAKQRKKKIFKR
ncbi:hypothetical protein A4A49_10946 [Nicotiana attenuata]|uniref:DUF4283 domain-containing protein n=1 Tax=Nicotiana attenuata TaxID=49451 RepID=A0A1J6IDQ0_NICAT|nr:hypothetical protein A4A49_10946 [Nicotiana attenuata]